MYLMRAFFVFLLLSIVICASALAQEVRSTIRTKYGPLAYRLYVPDQQADAMPLVVALHGCGQDGDVFSAVSGFDRLASQEKAVVVYPEESSFRNWGLCWNWFLEQNQVRGQGEPEMIVDLVRDIEKKYQVDPARVYAVGLSAGATLANALGFCYPDVFAGIGMQSGVEFRAASNAMEASQTLLMGASLDPAQSGTQAASCMAGRQSQRRQVPAIIFQGSVDRIVSPTNARQVLEQLVVANGILVNGQQVGSVKDWLLSEERRQVPHGYSYRVSDYGISPSQTLVRFVEVEEMGHAWSGGAGGYSFSDPEGPNATEMMWNFLSGFRLS